MNETIGFIGLGKMGAPMARHFLASGHNLVVCDLRDEAVAALVDLGAIPATSPGAVASEAETIIVSLPTPDVVKEVALGHNGVIAGSKVKVLIDLSTSGPDMAKEVAAGLAVRGLGFVDSPVSGGVAGAQAGTLAVMVACPDEMFAQYGPLLEAIGTVFHVGTEAGLGQTMKLANNLLTASAMALSAEAIVMGTKAGLDPEIMLDVINAGSGRNSATQDKFPRAILPRSFDFGFAAGLMQKDVALYVRTAKKLGVPIDVAGAVEQIWRKTATEFGYEADFTSIVRNIEQRAGVEVKPRPKEPKP
jgi:3-hydroxyisobutyrate dehydrogenase-like beta-hydroxyacid dehydrogenase